MAMTKQFTKTQWNNDREPAITAEQLNRMEKGIDDNDTRIVELDKAVTENKTAVDTSLAEVNKTLQKHTEDITAVNTDLTSQGKAIGELADKKITKFYASSQGDTTLSDSDDGKMQDMMLYGKSEQKQYSGKNLLNATLQTTTQNGITCKNNGDGTYTLNGTAVNTQFGLVIFDIMTDIPSDGKTYRVVGCPKTMSLDTAYIDCTNDVNKASKDIGSGTTISLTGEYAYKISIVVSEGYTCNNLVFKPMLVDAEKYPNATYDDYEPYVGGIPSPNPDYPQEIKSVVEPVVVIYGKNIAKKVTIVNVSAQYDIPLYIVANLRPSTTYVLSFECAKDYLGYINEKLFDQVNLVGTGNRQSIICKSKSVLPSAELFAQGWAFVKNYTGNKIIPKFTNVMLEEASTATAYEPYREQSVTLTGITLNAIPVSSGGNVTIDGQQYISDYVDVERGKIVRRCKEIDLGTLSYRLVTTEKRFVASIVPAISTTNTKNAICKNYLSATSIETYSKKYPYGISANEKNLYIEDERYTDATELKNAVNGVKAYYILATPTEESLSDELAEKLKALQTYYPQTNLFITSNQLDGYAIFNYPISLANGWNYVKQQIGDTRDYIYDMDLQMAQAYVNSEYAVALTELEV